MSKRLTKAQAAFLEEQDTKRAVQALGDRMDLEAEYRERQLELERRELEVQRAMQEAQAYCARRVAEELAAKTIAPAFKDFITGNTIAEVEAAIGRAQEKTAEIGAEFAEAQQVQQQPRDELGRYAVAGIPEPEIDFTKISYSDYVRQRDQIMRHSQDRGIFS